MLTAHDFDFTIPKPMPEEVKPPREPRSPRVLTRKKENSLKNIRVLFDAMALQHDFSAAELAEKRRGGVGCQYIIAKEFCEAMMREGYAIKIRMPPGWGYRKVKNAE